MWPAGGPGADEGRVAEIPDGASPHAVAAALHALLAALPEAPFTDAMYAEFFDAPGTDGLSPEAAADLVRRLPADRLEVVYHLAAVARDACARPDRTTLRPANLALVLGDALCPRGADAPGAAASGALTAFFELAAGSFDALFAGRQPRWPLLPADPLLPEPGAPAAPAPGWTVSGLDAGAGRAEDSERDDADEKELEARHAEEQDARAEPASGSSPSERVSSASSQSGSDEAAAATPEISPVLESRERREPPRLAFALDDGGGGGVAARNPDDDEADAVDARVLAAARSHLAKPRAAAADPRPAEEEARDDAGSESAESGLAPRGEDRDRDLEPRQPPARRRLESCELAAILAGGAVVPHPEADRVTERRAMRLLRGVRLASGMSPAAGERRPGGERWERIEAEGWAGGGRVLDASPIGPPTTSLDTKPQAVRSHYLRGGEPWVPREGSYRYVYDER